MEIFHIVGVLPFLIIFAIAIYSMLVVGFSLLKLLTNRTSATQSGGIRQSVQYDKPNDKPTLSGKIAITLSGIALVSGVVLMIGIGLPESIRLSLLVVLLPLLPLCAICAIGGVIIGSAKLSHGVWNLVGVAMGMIVLVSLSIWILTPVIFPK